MGVLEPGDEQAAIEVNDLRARPGQFGHVPVTNGNNPLAANGNCRSEPLDRIPAEDAPTREEKVWIAIHLLRLSRERSQLVLPGVVRTHPKAAAA